LGIVGEGKMVGILMSENKYDSQKKSQYWCSMKYWLPLYIIEWAHAGSNTFEILGSIGKIRRNSIT